jgi:hypothetical protein
VWKDKLRVEFHLWGISTVRGLLCPTGPQKKNSVSYQDPEAAGEDGKIAEPLKDRTRIGIAGLDDLSVNLLRFCYVGVNVSGTEGRVVEAHGVI